MSLAETRVLAKLSGRPERGWALRQLMVWQAFFDDSGNDPNQKVLVLAGFMAPYKKWVKFTREWQAELDREPKLNYFKFTQARALKGEFDDRKGWTEATRNIRVAHFIDIIRRHTVFQVSSAIQYDHFEKLALKVPVPERNLLSDKPYLLTVGRVAGAVSHITNSVKRAIIPNPVDCIFDLQQGYETEAHDLWRRFKEKNRDGDNLTLGSLNFEDEQDFIPLQAADLLAGCIRYYMIHKELPFPSAELLPTVPGLAWNWTGDEMRQYAVQMLLEAEAFSLRSPNAPLFEYDPKTAARQRKNARRQKGRTD